MKAKGPYINIWGKPSIHRDCEIGAYTEIGDTLEFRLNRNGFAFLGSYNSVPILTVRKSRLNIKGGTLSIKDSILVLK